MNAWWERDKRQNGESKQHRNGDPYSREKLEGTDDKRVSKEGCRKGHRLDRVRVGDSDRRQKPHLGSSPGVDRMKSPS